MVALSTPVIRTDTDKYVPQDARIGAIFGADVFFDMDLYRDQIIASKGNPGDDIRYFAKRTFLDSLIEMLRFPREKVVMLLSHPTPNLCIVYVHIDTIFKGESVSDVTWIKRKEYIDDLMMSIKKCAWEPAPENVEDLKRLYYEHTEASFEHHWFYFRCCKDILSALIDEVEGFDRYDLLQGCCLGANDLCTLDLPGDHALPWEAVIRVALGLLRDMLADCDHIPCIQRRWDVFLDWKWLKESTFIGMLSGRRDDLFEGDQDFVELENYIMAPDRIMKYVSKHPNIHRVQWKLLPVQSKKVHLPVGNASKDGHYVKRLAEESGYDEGTVDAFVRCIVPDKMEVYVHAHAALIAAALKEGWKSGIIRSSEGRPCFQCCFLLNLVRRWMLMRLNFPFKASGSAEVSADYFYVENSLFDQINKELSETMHRLALLHLTKWALRCID